MSEINYPPTGPLAPAAGVTVLHNVRPYGEGDAVSVRIVDGVIAEIGADVTADDAGHVVDGHGGVLLPGLVDMHVHFREPGREDTETIETGSTAAAKGGFTAVFTMANTMPVTDQPIIAESVWAKSQALGLCDVHPVGSITKGLEGTTLTEFGMMANSDAKVRVFSDDGKCVTDPLIMRRAIEYAGGMDVLIAQHAEDHRLTDGAVAHEGPTAARLGLRGWPRAAEESVVARDIMLARDYHARVHVCHATTAGTVDLLRLAKEQGITVTAEVTPHHLTLTDEKLETFDGNYRVNPPLREDTDAAALRQALIDGVIDVVATDHAPHGAEDKCIEFDQAKPGMLGLETSLAIIAELFVHTGLKDWRWVAQVMSERPAEITRLPGHGRPIAVGEPGNLTVVVDEPWTVDRTALASKTENSPFDGESYATRVQATLLRGVPTWDADHAS